MLVKKARHTPTVVWRRVTHVLVKQSGFRKPLLALLALLMVMTAAQIGPLTLSASAEPLPQNKHCPYPGATKRDPVGDGGYVEWICKRFFAYPNDPLSEYWEWEFSKYVPGSMVKLKTATRYSNSPPYIMRIQSAVGNARGGGTALGAIVILNRDGTSLNRRIAVRTIMEYAPTATSGYYNCHDKGWKEAPTQRHYWWTAIGQYTEPDCGTGYYRAQVAGRFYSVSLNQWITSQWHYSDAVYLSAPPPPTSEPTVTPGPAVTGNP